MSSASGKKNDRASTKRGDGERVSDMQWKCGRLLYLKARDSLEKCKSRGRGGGKKEGILENSRIPEFGILRIPLNSIPGQT